MHIFNITRKTTKKVSLFSGLLAINKKIISTIRLFIVVKITLDKNTFVILNF